MQSPGELTRRSVWRVLRGPNNDWPLAVCDYESVDLEADTINCDVIHEHCLGENILLFKNSKHKWYYLSYQDIDDLIVFRNTSSKGQRSGTLRLVVTHAAELADIFEQLLSMQLLTLVQILRVLDTALSFELWRFGLAENLTKGTLRHQNSGI